MNTAYAYIRFSTAEQAKGHSRERQLDACKRYCEKRGLKLSEDVYFDAGASGFRGEHLEEGGALRRFITDVDNHRIPKGSPLLVENLDRLSRLEVEDAFLLLNSLLQKGIVVVTLDDEREFRRGGDTLSLVASLLQFDRSHGESSRKSDTLKKVFAAKRERAKGGLPMGNVAPHWLQLKEDRTGYEPVPSKVAAVQRIFQLCIDGYGKNTIAKKLNAEGYATLSGRERVAGWGTSAVHHVIMNRAVLGEWQPMTRTEDPRRKIRTPAGPPIPGYFPQVIAEDIFLRAQDAIATRRTTKSTRQSATFNVWQGVAKCMHCGSPMHMVNKGRPPRGFSYLDCSLGRKGKCAAHKLIRLDHSEKVFRLMLARLDMRALVMESAEKLTQALAATEGGLSVQRSKLTQMTELLVAAPSRSLAAALAKTEAEISELERERDRLRQELATEDAISFETFMARLNLDDWEGRSLANSLLKRHGVLVFVADRGFIVTETGRVRFGVGYDKARAEAGFFDISAFARQRDEDPLHVAASKALPRKPSLHFVMPQVAGPLAYVKETDEDYARDAMRENEGYPASNEY